MYRLYIIYRFNSFRGLDLDFRNLILILFFISRLYKRDG